MVYLKRKVDDPVTFCFASRVDLAHAFLESPWKKKRRRKGKGETRGDVKKKKSTNAKRNRPWPYTGSPWILSRLESRDVLAASCVTIASKNGRHFCLVSVDFSGALSFGFALLSFGVASIGPIRVQLWVDGDRIELLDMWIIFFFEDG